MTDDHVQIEMAAAVYPNTAEAQATLNDLVDLHNKGVIELLDAAVMVRTEEGALSISERAELTPAKGAKRGAIFGAVIGVIFPPSLLAAAAIGAAAGAITGKLTDQGFENQMLQDIAEELEPGKSAILVVVEHTWYAQLMDAVDGYEKVLGHSLQADEAGSIMLRN